MQYCYQQTWMNYEEPKLFDNPGWPRRFPRRGINFYVERFSQQIQITGSSTRLNSCIVADCAEDVVHCAHCAEDVVHCAHCARLCFTASSRSILPVREPGHYRTPAPQTLPGISEHYQTLQNILEHYRVFLNITKSYKTFLNITGHRTCL